MYSDTQHCISCLERSPNPSTSNRYKSLRNLVVSVIRRSRSAYFKNVNPSNKKEFWKAIKHLSKQKSSIPSLSLNGVTASTDSAKATMLNNFFFSCFNSAVPPLCPFSDDSSTSYSYCPDDFLCTEDEVSALISSLNTSKANGPDGISTRMLKGTLSSIVPSLTRLFNISIKTGEFPH